MDGNYGGTIAPRLGRADTAICLDMPTAVCVYRVISRCWRTRGKACADLNEGCPERMTWEMVPFLHYVLTFNRRKRRWFLDTLDKRDPPLEILILKGTEAIEAFLRRFEMPNVNPGRTDG